MQIQIPKTARKLNLRQFLKGKNIKNQSQEDLLPTTNRTYITTNIEQDQEQGEGYRMQNLKERYKQMQVEKMQNILTPKDKIKKVKNFMRRMQYFESVRQEKMKIKQRLKEIYDDKSEQVLYYPVGKAKEIDFSEKQFFDFDEKDYLDLDVTEEESIRCPEE